MVVDWVTVLVSAAISAIVGTVVSLVAVYGQTVRRIRAERSVAAQHTIRQLLAPIRLSVRRHRLEGSRGDKPRRDGTAHGDDLILAMGVVAASEDFGPLRRSVVGWRTRRIFGGEFYKIAALHQPETAESATSLMVAQWVREVGATRKPITFIDGLLHRALSSPPSSPLSKKLERELNWLARGW